MKKLIVGALAVMGMMFSCATVYAAVPTNGLVAEYLFSGNANDTSGNRNNGIVNGTTLTTDRNGNANSAYLFGGDTPQEYIQATLDLPTGNSSRSVSVWFSTTDIVSAASGFNFNTLISWGNASVNHMNDLSVASGKVFFSGYANDYQVPIIVSDGEWHHFVFTHDELTSTSYIYLDGIEQLTFSTMYDTSASDLFIGKRVDHHNQYMNGKIDDVRIYNIVLSEGEIQELYTGSSGPPILETSINAHPTIGSTPLDTDFTCAVDSGTPPYNYSWDFGDGSTSTLQNPSHTYSIQGSYLAQVAVTDSSGQSIISALNIQVNASVAQVDYVVLTDISPNTSITEGRNIKVYGTASSNQVTLASGGKAELINFPGSNTITIQSNSSLFTVC